jgi:hypothetical protein
MNQRIRELEEQASIFAFTEYPKQTMATFFTNKSVEQLFNEKFAELIVKECIQVAVNKDSGYMHPANVAGHMAAGRSIAAQMIREHFGVES